MLTALMFAIALCVFLGLWTLCHIARANGAEKRRDELETLFGTFWTPEAAWAVLQKLAKEFHERAMEEIKSQQARPEDVDALSVTAGAELAAGELNNAKRRFWEAYTLAKENWDSDWPDLPPHYKAFLNDPAVTN